MHFNKRLDTCINPNNVCRKCILKENCRNIENRVRKEYKTETFIAISSIPLIMYIKLFLWV